MAGCSDCAIWDPSAASRAQFFVFANVGAEGCVGCVVVVAAAPVAAVEVVVDDADFLLPPPQPAASRTKPTTITTANLILTRASAPFLVTDCVDARSSLQERQLALVDNRLQQTKGVAVSAEANEMSLNALRRSGGDGSDAGGVLAMMRKPFAPIRPAALA